MHSCSLFYHIAPYKIKKNSVFEGSFSNLKPSSTTIPDLNAASIFGVTYIKREHQIIPITAFSLISVF